MKTVWHKDPSAGNPRNSEGAFLRLDDGRILFAYSSYVGDSSHDHGAMLLAYCYSGKEEKTPLAALRIKKIDLGEISEKIPARQ